MLMNMPKFIIAYYIEVPDSLEPPPASFIRILMTSWFCFHIAFNEWHILAISQARRTDHLNRIMEEAQIFVNDTFKDEIRCNKFFGEKT